MPTRLYTIEIKTPDQFLNMMRGLKSQTLRLRSYSVELSTKNPPYRSISIQIGSVIGPDYVIDNDIGNYFFKLPLDQRYIDVGTDIQYTFSTSCDIPLNMSGDLESSFRITCLSETHEVIPAADFKYLFLQFECSE